VAPSEAWIGRLFSRLAPRYARFNRWASMGQDDRWRRHLWAGVAPTARVLDLGTGTGDLLRLRHGGLRVGVDLSDGMLREARGRVTAEGWAQASGAALPFASGAFDVVVSAYVLRNLQQGGVLEPSLVEAARVLRPGGTLRVLDLTRPANAFLRAGHGFYLRVVLPAVGRFVFGRDWPGEYLKMSIEALWSTDRLKEAFLRAGFRRFSVRPYWGGVVSLFTGEK
jgi:demethylmenaquinone methyltransferase/2-methoxy-6-polyprenyl-1,4-benzoquinol methylase